MRDDFLLEIQSEELPPKALLALQEALLDSLAKQLTEAALAYQMMQGFAAPRRLGVLIQGLAEKQADRTMTRRGPAYTAAYDEKGQPTKACISFAASCHVTVDQLEIQQTEKGKWIAATVQEPGKTIFELMPDIVTTAIRALPIPKWMRWGRHDEEYARPVHHVVMLYGKKVMDALILGLKTGATTLGHRIHHPKPVHISSATLYESILEKAFVIADFAKRKENIRAQIEKLASPTSIDENLLDEVTGIVEWPVALMAHFDKQFLSVPKEALISAMKTHQKSFPLMDAKGQLQAQFIFVANLKSEKPEEVIRGNERVMTARLSDAQFFYETDLKTPLQDFADRLQTVVYQKGLGTLLDKARRLEKLSRLIAEKMEANAQHLKATARAGFLAKADLMTAMVGEFPELQGVMGYHYAKAHDESLEVCQAIAEHYYPRFANDAIASNPVSIAVSLADKLDTLVGLFGIKQIPTGSKDPFALRRAALGLIRTIIENRLSFDIVNLINAAKALYSALPNQQLNTELLSFIRERMRVWIKEQYSVDCFDAVDSLNINDLYDRWCRIQALHTFKQTPDAPALIEANKRVHNILKKTEHVTDAVQVNLLIEKEERALYDAIEKEKKLQSTATQLNYNETLNRLAQLKTVIENFFERVLVNAEDEKLKQNRLNLLTQLRTLFLYVGDIALLQ